jgi:hypothetical protein
MSPLSKPPLPKPPVSKSASSQADLRGTNLYRVAIVGAASLKGKEIAEILRERNFPAVDVRLLDDDESLGQLEAVGDEMSFIQSIRSEQFERVPSSPPIPALPAIIGGRRATWAIPSLMSPTRWKMKRELRSAHPGLNARPASP